jgi:hypothetical protein
VDGYCAAAAAPFGADVGDDDVGAGALICTSMLMGTSLDDPDGSLSGAKVPLRRLMCDGGSCRSWGGAADRIVCVLFPSCSHTMVAPIQSRRPNVRITDTVITTSHPGGTLALPVPVLVPLP